LETADASELTARLVHHLCLGGLVDEALTILTSTRHFCIERPASWAPAAEAVAKARPTPELSLLAASIEEAAGHYNAALSLLAALLRTRPAAPWRARARIQAGACYLRLSNIRRAVHYLARALAGESSAGDRARALDLLARAHIRRGVYAEALAYARRGIEVASVEGAASVASVGGAASVASVEGAASVASAEGAASGAPDLSVMADLNDSIGLAATYLGDAETARRHFRTAARLHEETGDRRAQARSADYQALNEFRAGNTLEAAQGYRAALEMAERHGTSRQVASAVLNVGSSSHQLGDLGHAHASYERALRMAVALGLSSTEATLRYNLAKLYADIGLFERAEAAARRGETAAREVGARLLVAVIAMEIGNIALLTGDRGRAIERFRDARGEFAAQSAVREVVEVDLHLAEAELLARDIAASARTIERAAAAASPLGARDLSAQIAVMRGRAALAREETSAAMDHLEEAARLARACGQRVLLATALGWLSAACERDGAAFLARRYKAEARELWERMAASLPRHFRDAFWAHPARAGARGAAEGPSIPALSLPLSPTPSPRERKLERLLAINKKLNSSLDVKEVLSCAIDSAIELTGSERGFVILASEGSGAGERGGGGDEDREGELHVAVARNMDHERISKSHLKFSRGIAEQVISRAEPVITSSAHEDPRFAGHASVHNMRLESVISAPICAPDGVLGALYLDHRFRKALFSAEDVDLVMAFADQVAIALTNARRRGELARRAEELVEERQRIEQRVIGQVEEIDRLTEQVRASQEALGHRYDYGRIVGRSAAMQAVFKRLDRVIDSPASVLIQGESGTGKELIAKAIHFNGPRRGKPFVAVNCGAVPEGLLESELFGHVKGAFTNATRNNAGLFAAASGGTLFLDEIGEMPPSMQIKLLRALQEREVRPIGGTAAVPIDVRVICATNRRLRDEVARGLFRMDLFYRIGVVEIALPPLRERAEDIPLLAAHLLEQVAREHKRPPPKLTPQAARALMTRRWPGNVRELENALTNAMLLAEGDRITPADLLPPSEPIEDVAGPPILDRRRFEAEDIVRIKAAIQAANGNVSEAARALGMPRASLYRKLSRFELQRGAPPEPLPPAPPPPPGKRRRGAVSSPRHRPPSGRRPR
jgi:transcriptional regulator with GAF, ATPase, and Fis domain/tetratricopeptide (TPR) repeat protein